MLEICIRLVCIGLSARAVGFGRWKTSAIQGFDEMRRGDGVSGTQVCLGIYTPTLMACMTKLLNLCK